MFPPYKYIITRILRNVNKNIRKIRKKNNRDFHTTKLNLPTGNLDSKTGEEIMRLFHELHDQGNTIVLITHDEGVALQAERRIAIFDGHVREVME